ncbi:MAG: PD40 domain-containing protein [Planctomycetes bacterium]|nr:PD40 domain-containing protein [Planctomycetota bacterium]
MSHAHVSLGAIATLAIAAGSQAQSEYFVAPTPIAELNLAGSNNFSPTVSEDELYMVFASDRPGGLGGYDLYETQRPTVDSLWSPPQNLVQLNSAGDDYEPNLSFDGTELHFISTRAGGLGTSDIYVSQRPSVAAPWGPPQNVGAPINGPGITNDDPALTQNGLTMFFTTGGNIATSTRPALGAPWSPPQLFAPANSGSFDHSPIPEGEGDVVWFSSTRAGGAAGSSDFWMVYRDPAGVYSAPIPIADLSTPDWDSNGARGLHTGRMYASQFIGGFATLWLRCPRAVVVWVSRCVVSIMVPHIQLFPPRITWRRVWLASIQVPVIRIVWYRWFPWPFGGLSALAVSIGLNNPPIPAGALVPGGEGDLFVSGAVVLGLRVIPPNQPPGLEVAPYGIPNDPNLIGLPLHFQNFGIDLGTNLLTLSQPATVMLTQ